MRNLRIVLTLIARQFTDDGPLFLGAFAVATVFLLLLSWAGFLHPWAHSLHAAMLVLLLPSVAGIGSLFFGAIQVCSDNRRGGITMLSTLAVTPSQLAFARIVAGLTGIVATVVSLGTAIFVAIKVGLVQWPPALFPRGIVDLSVALALIGAAGYSFGLLVAQGSRILVSSLGLAVLMLLPLSTFVIKGLGQPSFLVLTPLLGALLVYPFVSRNHLVLSRMLFGCVVLTMTVLSLFWLRHAGQPLIPQGMFHRTGGGDISSFVYALVVGEFATLSVVVFAGLGGALLVHHIIRKNHPRISPIWIRFAVLAVAVVSLFWLWHIKQALMSELKFQRANSRTFASSKLLDPLGEVDPSSASFSLSVSVSPGRLEMWSNDAEAVQPAGVILDIAGARRAWRYRHPVFRRHFPVYSAFRYDERKRLFVRGEDSGAWYAGPDGISPVPAEIGGRFGSPVVCWVDRRGLIVFDSESRRFHAIDPDSEEVRLGPPVPDVTFHPFDVSTPRLRSAACSLRGYHGGIYQGSLRTDDSGELYVPVVEESGDISILNVNPNVA